MTVSIAQSHYAKARKAGQTCVSPASPAQNLPVRRTPNVRGGSSVADRPPPALLDGRKKMGRRIFPLDPTPTEEAYKRNRRIELKLTER